CGHPPLGRLHRQALLDAPHALALAVDPSLRAQAPRDARLAVKRVAILGSGGAGKTWLANELGRRTGLPVVHLDRIFWAPGWTEREPAAAKADLAEVVGRDEWILDGNFLNRLGAERLARADTVVFLDVP